MALLMLFAIIAVAIISLLLDIGVLEWHFITIEETDVIFIVRGGEPQKCIIGLPRGEHFEKITRSLETRGIEWVDRTTSLIARRTGRYFTSWLYPLVKVHRFTVMAGGLKDGSGAGKEKPKEGAPLREWMYQDKREVRSLRTRFPRPVLVEGTEMMDTFRVDNIVMLMLRVVDPYIPVFTYKGDFFRMVNAITESVLNDMVVSKSSGRSYKYTEYVQEDKGDGSEFAKELKKKIHSGLKALGLECEKAYLHAIALAPGQETQMQAALAAETAELQAKAVRATADGALYATKRQAEGEAFTIKTKGEADGEANRAKAQPLIDAGADADLVSVGILNRGIAEGLPRELSTLAQDGKIFISVSDKS